MKRKVSKIGQSTLMVSLPHQWVKDQGIKKGDEVEVEISNNELSIYSQKKCSNEKKERSITITTPYRKIVRVYLNNLYRMGYDRIIVFFDDKRTLESIRHVVTNYLLGFEIVQEEENKCIIESLTEPTSEKSEVLLRKIFFILQESLDILTNDMKGGNFEKLSVLEELMMRCDRFCNFYSRTLMKEKELNPFEWTMVQKLLMTQHGIYYCYKAVALSGYKKFHSDIIKYLEDVKKRLQALVTLYYKKDLKEFEKSLKLNDELLYMRLSELQKTKEGIMVAPHLFGIVKIMPTMGGATLSKDVQFV